MASDFNNSSLCAVGGASDGGICLSDAAVLCEKVLTSLEPSEAKGLQRLAMYDGGEPVPNGIDRLT